GSCSRQIKSSRCSPSSVRHRHHKNLVAAVNLPQIGDATPCGENTTASPTGGVSLRAVWRINRPVATPTCAPCPAR
ncbi:hypothetical protein, partial [Dickeya dianthicola]|uniref:hypothetical protein n=1 Tax=Dickeya dianthicola TaxID=204039 RepID=UPI001F621C08